MYLLNISLLLSMDELDLGLGKFLNEIHVLQQRHLDFVNRTQEGHKNESYAFKTNVSLYHNCSVNCRNKNLSSLSLGL